MDRMVDTLKGSLKVVSHGWIKKFNLRVLLGVGEQEDLTVRTLRVGEMDSGIINSSGKEKWWR